MSPIVVFQLPIFGSAGSCPQGVVPLSGRAIRLILAACAGHSFGRRIGCLRRLGGYFGGCGDGEEGVGEHRQGDVAVPGIPFADLVVVLYIDALVVKIREGGVVDNRAAHLVVGVDVEGFKHVLGIWIQDKEGATFWGSVLAELRNRGLKDALIVCCDGLTGLPEAIEQVWPQAKVQTCVTHLIRASMKFVSYGDRKAVAKALRPIYTAVNEAAAKAALENLRREYGKKYPGVVVSWERAWEQFIPFLEFEPEIRKVIYTTNAIESINFQLRKITKNRGHFPDTNAAMKLLYLGVRNITGRHIDGSGLVRERGERGTGTYGWKRALNALAVRFGDRLPL
jgi:putative transposase